VELVLAWKMYVPVAYRDSDEFLVRFAIRAQSPTKQNYFIKYNNNTGEYSLNEYNYGDNDLSQTLIGPTVTPTNSLIEFSLNIDLTPFKFADLYDENMFVIAIYPLHQKTSGGTITYPDMVIGDFEIKIQTTPEENEYEYLVNTGFLNKKEEKLRLFDSVNYNYINTLYVYDAFLETRNILSAVWKDRTDTEDSLLNWYARAAVGYGMETRQKLTADIIFNESKWIKPLSLFTDDTVPDKTFLLKQFSLNIAEDIYNITAEEYADEADNIIIE
jgi:hypothetical protein